MPARKRSRGKLFLSLVTAVVAFLAYTCVYAYRKPFTLLESPDRYWGVGYQTLLIIVQVIGYMFSKFAGIRYISELRKKHRLASALALVGTAWLCLLGFALVPEVYGIGFLFLNGFCLGFLWGIIFSYVEGRTMTDFIGAAMAVSFIFAGGFTRTVGKWILLTWDADPQWMPFLTGLLFVAPFICLLLLLDRMPPPDEEDVATRQERVPMNKPERKMLLAKWGAGLAAVITCYVILTIMRDLRDNYMSVIWRELGYSSSYAVFTQTETIITLIILAAMASVVFMKNNFVAFRIIHWVIAGGLVLALLASMLFLHEEITGAAWMQLVGIGLYLGYIPFNCIFFERLIATFRIQGTVGFLMYFSDSFGYLGSVGVMLYKEFFSYQMQWSTFYCTAVQIGCFVAIAGILFSFYFFNKRYSCLNPKPSSSALV